MNLPLASTNERGYGSAHQAERRKYQKRIERGEVFVCARAAIGECDHPQDLITVGSDWDLGHNADRTAWTGPEHVDCNRRAGGRNGAAVTNSREFELDW